MRQSALRRQFVEFIPEQLDEGVLYVSERYGTATHLCCCGCGSEVVTPIGPTDWALEVVNGAVTLAPSIGNWSLPCRSHYLVRQGRVVWARDMSRGEIELGRERDQRLRDAHFARVNRLKEAVRAPTRTAHQHSDAGLGSFWRTVRRWLGRSR